MVFLHHQTVLRAEKLCRATACISGAERDREWAEHLLCFSSDPKCIASAAELAQRRKYFVSGISEGQGGRNELWPLVEKKMQVTIIYTRHKEENGGYMQHPL